MKSADPSATAYETVPLEKGDLVLSIPATGVIEARFSVEIKSKASGEINRVFKEEGDVIAKGEPLVEIDPQIEEIGVRRAKADLIAGEAKVKMEADDRVIIPVTTYQKRLFRGDLVRSLLVQVDDALNTEKTVSEISKKLRQKHRLRPGVEDDFHIALQTEVVVTMAMVSRTFGLLLGAVVSVITLLVGGVGIMNIMLVSVTERTGEIGLRRAVGAKKSDIRKQLLTEAVAVSLTGGCLGLLLGVGSGWQALFTVSSFVIPLAFPVGIGLFFGLFPALKASRLDPAEALRHG